MLDTNNSDLQPGPAEGESEESFGALLSQYEQSHSKKSADGEKQIIATVLSVSGERILVDIGYKIEGALAPAAFSPGELPKPGDQFPVSVKGRNEDGYYDVTIRHVRQPTDWASLERAFEQHAVIVGTVSGTIKGGLTVDIGVRAFLPASRSGTHDAAEMEKLVGGEIRCRILNIDVAEEDVVVDRRSVLEEEQRAGQERLIAALHEGDIVTGEVRSLTTYGAFVDLGGVDGLLHISDIAWSRVGKPEDVLSIGQHLETRVLKVDPETRRISLGLKQLQSNPWDEVSTKYHIGDRIRGIVSRTMDFGAFVELEPGVEGLIHLSEMSWTRKNKKPGDIVKRGDTVEAIILSVSQSERRIGLGLKQTLSDPWADAAGRFPAGSIIEGAVTSFTAFGAFVQAAEGIEGMIHISEIGGERRLHHPQEALKLGQTVRAQVIEIDTAKRQMKLSIKRTVPVSLDEYLAEHATGDLVTGRVIKIDGGAVHVELGEGIHANCRMASAASENQSAGAAPSSGEASNLSSLTAMLQARWKGKATNQPSAQPRQSPELPHPGQIRTFRITAIDAASKAITLDLVE